MNTWNAFSWKKGCELREDKPAPRGHILPDLVRKYREEYQALSLDQKTEIVKQFEESKQARSVTHRLTTRARASDATHTLASIRNQAIPPP
ncbi:hypothetical protein JVT61DRAFT_15480 [Boletus reticuloceps]|uniref:Uncharacterized protein n=1 Tax=Boletus reticuloceps TaxID=495285 RepID=A0A8I2YCB2_9AGAM|nr:hypothetical protein JVT61DRAFT_15480 [Boletus reticuloceps]